jgi:CBS domain-containing protein
LVAEDTIRFLRKIPPFQFLDDSILQRVSKNARKTVYPKDTIILQQDGQPSEYLRVIRKGGVKVYRTTETGEEIVIDFRGEGDTFGFLSLIGKDKAKANIIATEDTVCYLLDKETVKSLIETSSIFTEYFLKSHLAKYIDKSFGGKENKSLLFGSADSILFKTRVDDIGLKDIITVEEFRTIKESAKIMSQNKISSLIIINGEQQPSGIVTDRDLREKVVAAGRDVSEPIRNIMTSPLIRVDTSDFCFEAVIKMIKNNIHHIVVMEKGFLKGILTNHDILVLQGTSPLSVVRDIEAQNTIEGLIPESGNINKIIALLLKEGAKASNITGIITEINDRLLKKILAISENKFGPPPVPYCWIVFGSEGRKEQTYRTDQDNAIIYIDPVTEDQKEAARGYFHKFSEFARDALLQCGFPLCHGNYMASNPTWRQPLNVWKDYFSQWISTPTPDAVLASCILFDFRPVHGDSSLAEHLREHLQTKLKNQDMFLKLMAQLTINLRPPIGLFKGFIVEKTGKHKNKLNLKFTCLAPLVNIVRLFSLETYIPETSTLDRLHALKAIHAIVGEFGEELEHAFEFLTMLKIRHQHEQIQQGQEPDNFINPKALSNFEQKVFKESCQAIFKIQDMINKKYNPGTGSIL